MSASLELVRSILVPWERGDYFSSGDWANPEIEFVRADGPAPGRWTGLAGMAQAWGDVLSAWEELRIETDEYRELDDERLLVLLHYTGRGRTSGMELGHMRTTGAAVFHVRGGKVAKIVGYLDRDRALADLGLAPGADYPDSKSLPRLRPKQARGRRSLALVQRTTGARSSAGSRDARLRPGEAGVSASSALAPLCRPMRAPQRRASRRLLLTRKHHLELADMDRLIVIV